MALSHLYEVWITTDAGSMTTTVITVTASSDREAYRKAQELHPDQVVRGVVEVGAEQ